MVSKMDFTVNGHSRTMLKFQQTGFHLENMFCHSDGTLKDNPKFGIPVPLSKLLQNSRYLIFVCFLECEINISYIFNSLWSEFSFFQPASKVLYFLMSDLYGMVTVHKLAIRAKINPILKILKQYSSYSLNGNFMSHQKSFQIKGCFHLRRW